MFNIFKTTKKMKEETLFKGGRIHEKYEMLDHLETYVTNECSRTDINNPDYYRMSYKNKDCDSKAGEFLRNLINYDEDFKTSFLTLVKKRSSELKKDFAEL